MVPYIDTYNDLVWRPPMLASGAVNDCFVLVAPDRDKLQAAFDARYAAARPGLKAFVLPTFIVSFGSYAAASSLTSPWKERGRIPYDECAVWLLALTTDGSVTKPFSLLVTLPYIYVSSHYAAMGAREIYGIQKKIGEIDLAQPGTSQWECRTIGFQKYGPTEEAKLAPLIRIGGHHHEAPATSTHDDLLGMTRAVLSHMADTAIDDIAGLTAHLVDLATHEIAHNVPLAGIASGLSVLTLKQIRHYAHFDLAEAQDLLLTEFSFQSVSASVFPGGQQIEFLPMASEPMAKEFGLPSTMTALLRLRLECDAILGTPVHL